MEGDADGEDAPTDHLENVDDGFGCVEMWEHTDEQRQG